MPNKKPTGNGLDKLDVGLFFFLLLIFGFGMVVGKAQAAESWSVGVVGGTTGIGPVVRYYPSPKLSIGLEHTQYAFKPEWGTLKIGVTMLSASYHPFDNGLFGSVGLGFNSSGGEARFKESKSYTYADRTVTLSGHAKAKLEFNPFAPYVGIGYEVRSRRSFRLGYRFDLGILIAGKPELSGNADLKLEYIHKDKGNLWHMPSQLVRGYVEEELDELREKYDYRYWPVAKFSINYQF